MKVRASLLAITLMIFALGAQAARPGKEALVPQISSDLKNAIHAIEAHLGQPLKLTAAQAQEMAANESAFIQSTQTASLQQEMPLRRFYCFGAQLAIGWDANGAICSDSSGTIATLSAFMVAGLKANLAASIVNVKGPYVLEGENYRGVYSRPAGGSFSWIAGGQVIHFRSFESVDRRRVWDQTLTLSSLLAGWGVSLNTADMELKLD